MGGGETVLVVEDEPDVRMLVIEVLGILGYRALEAPEADAALALLQGDEPIDLMISDVGLPGMNGRELAGRARELRAGLAVLLITGYSAEATDRAGFLGPGIQMMTKPFQIDQLAGKIREMLEPGRPAA